MSSEALLAKLSTFYKEVDLNLREDYWGILKDLGNPHLKLPPLIHVAGTNGKGSCIAFMRSIAESVGATVHAYTSPHLVHLNERIRLGGKLIEEDQFVGILEQIAAKMGARKLTQFEVLTIAAFMAFSRQPAHLLLLETGMGGRLDATNIVPAAMASAVTRISYDHRTFLGNTLSEIAFEKAGIFKKKTPAIIGPQADAEVKKVFIDEAAKLGIPLYMHGRDWDFTYQPDGFRLKVADQNIDLPMPSLVGKHQIDNAATATIAMFTQKAFDVTMDALQNGITQTVWPARLQHLTRGPIVQKFPADWEVWLDGGHNDSAGEALAEQAEAWSRQARRPLYVIYGMINTKSPPEFLKPLKDHLKGVAAIAVPGEDKTLPPDVTARAARALGVKSVWECASALEAADRIAEDCATPARILITGSLYLAGWVLHDHG